MKSIWDFIQNSNRWRSIKLDQYTCKCTAGIKKSLKDGDRKLPFRSGEKANQAPSNKETGTRTYFLKGDFDDLLQIIGQTTIHNIVQLVSSRDHSLKAIGQLNCKLKTRSSQMNWFTYNNTLSTLKSRHGTLMVATQRGSSRSTNTKYGLKRVTANNHMNLIHYKITIHCFRITHILTK